MGPSAACCGPEPLDLGCKCADGEMRQKISVSLGLGLLGPDGHGCRSEAPEVRLVLKQDGAEPPGCGSDIRHLEVGQFFVLAPINLTTLPQVHLCLGPKNSFLANLWENRISTSNNDFLHHQNKFSNLY